MMRRSTAMKELFANTVERVPTGVGSTAEGVLYLCIASTQQATSCRSMSAGQEGIAVVARHPL